MKKVIAVTLMCCSIMAAQAQLKKTDEIKAALATTNKDTTAWAYGGFFNFGINEGFLHNWAAGGELASFTVNTIFSGHFDRLAGKVIWSNNLDITYGLNYTYSTFFVPKKTDDRIDFTSKYGTRLDTAKNWYYSALFNFKSQFTKGYDYTKPDWQKQPTSKFFAPAYFTFAVGFEYRKGSDVSLFFSPIATRVTFVDKYYTSLSQQGAFGVDYNKTVKYEFGAYFSGRYLVDLSKKVKYKTRLDLYSNYLAKDTKDSAGTVVKRDNPGNIAVLFDNLFTYKMSKRFNLTFGATFIYDNNLPYSKTYLNTTTNTVELKDDPARNIGWLQIKQLFTFGMEYKF